MRKITISFPLACLLLSGCATNNAYMDNIGKIGGTAAGAGVGAVIGKQIAGDNGLIIGALIGGGIGYLIGDEIDKRRSELAKIAKKEKVEVYSENITTENLATVEQTKETDSSKKADVIGDSFTVISDDAQFNIGSSALNPKATQVFSQFAQQYKNTDKKILIIGNTDDSGDSAFNQKLSEDRAKNVGEIFRNQGINQANIYYLGAGEMNPIADNNSVAGANKNRRVEIVELKNESDISNFALSKKTNPNYFRKTTPTLVETTHKDAEKNKSLAKDDTSINSKIKNTDNKNSVLKNKEHSQQNIVTNFIELNGTKLKDNSFALSSNFGHPFQEKSKLSLINTAQASDSLANVSVNCMYDKPRSIGKTKSLETGKSIEHSTTEFKKGLNEVPWITEVDGHLIGINPVGVLSNGSQVSKNPNISIYKDYSKTNHQKADLNLTSNVNTYQGTDGLIYRIFLDDKNNQLQCMDIVFNEKNIQESNGVIYYSKNNEFYERKITVNQLTKK